MKNWTTTIAAAAIASCLPWVPAVAASATAWRCGSTYSDRLCEGGRALGVDDARDAAQKRDADRTIREAQAAGERMERDRLRREKAQAGPAVIEGRPAAPKPETVTAGANKKKKGKKEPEYFSAHDPVATAKKKAEKAEKAAARRGGDKS